MAPITSFIEISRDSVLPVRVMVNRKAILNHNILTEHAIPLSLTHNNKAVIRLRKTLRIKLSNNDMRNLIDDIKVQMLKITLETPLEELIEKYGGQKKEKNKSETISRELDLNDSVVNKNRLVIPVTTPKGWKCLAVVYLKSLEILRLSLVDPDTTVLRNERFSSGGAQLLVRSLELKQKKGKKDTVIIREENDDENMRIPEEGEIIEDDDDDMKKNEMKVKYQGKRIIGRGVDLVVLSRP